MKNFKNLYAYIILILYAFLAGASIDETGITMIIIQIIASLAIIPIYFICKAHKKEARRNEIDKAKQKIADTYILDSEGDGYASYYDDLNEKILIIVSDTKNHTITEIPNIKKTKSFSYEDSSFNLYYIIDDNNKKIIFAIIKDLKVNYKILNYTDILGVEICKNGSSIFNKSTSNIVGRTVVGGVLLGAPGAIIGGTTGKSKETKTINSYKIIIQLSDLQNPTYEIEFINYTLEIDELSYKELIKIESCINKIKSVLLAIIKSNELELNKTHIDNVKKSDKNLNDKFIADELLKLSELNKNGILSDDEYEAQKKKLLIS